MNITVSIDDDVAYLLNREIRGSGKSLQESVNHYLRGGLMEAEHRTKKPFLVTPRAMGLPPRLIDAGVEELLASLEGELHL